jgi:membrane protein
MKNIWSLIKQTVSSWLEDYAPSMGAAIAFYTMFSIGPLIFIVIAVAGMVFGEEAARGEIFAQLQGLIGEKSAAGVEEMVEAADDPERGPIGAAIGVVALVIGATTVFAELQSALDRIWRAPARETGGIWRLLRARFLSFGLVLGIGFLLIASLIVSAALAAFGRWWAPLFGGWEVLAQVANFAVSFSLITAAFAMIYKYMPRVHIAWRDVWIGAAVTALLFTIGKFAIGLYIGKTEIASAYGAAGALAVLLIWVYYSAAIFLMGAEFTWVYAHAHGSRQGQPREAAAAPVPRRDDTGAETVAGAAFGTPARRLQRSPAAVAQRSTPMRGVWRIAGLALALAYAMRSDPRPGRRSRAVRG